MGSLKLVQRKAPKSKGAENIPSTVVRLESISSPTITLANEIPVPRTYHFAPLKTYLDSLCAVVRESVSVSAQSKPMSEYG